MRSDKTLFKAIYASHPPKTTLIQIRRSQIKQLFVPLLLIFETGFAVPNFVCIDHLVKSKGWSIGEEKLIGKFNYLSESCLLWTAEILVCK